MAVNEVAVKSPIAAAMGARISVTGPGRGMYLVTGRNSPTKYDYFFTDSDGSNLIMEMGIDITEQNQA